MRAELKQLDQGLKQQVADRTGALTDANRRLEAEVEQRKLLAEENLVMAEIGKITSSELNMEQIYQRLSEEAQKLVPFHRVSINYVDLLAGTVSNNFVAGLDLCEGHPYHAVPIQGSLTEAAISDLSGKLYQPLSIQEVMGDYPGLIPNYQAGLKSFLAVPMIANAAITGVLLFQSANVRAYTRRHLDLAVRLASQIAPSVANARLYAQRKQAEEETAAIAEIGRIFSSSLDIETVWGRFTEKLQTLIPFDWVFVHNIDPDEKVFTRSCRRGPHLPEPQESDTYPLAGSLSGKVFEARQSVLFKVNSRQEAIASLPSAEPLFLAGTRCMLGVPFISAGQVIAVLILASKSPDAYNQREVDLATRVAYQVAGTIASSIHFIRLRETEMALRESEERFRQVVNQAADPFYLTDRHGKIVDVNESACTVLGYSREELLKLGIGDFSVDSTYRSPETIQQNSEARWQELIKGKTVTVERMHRRKDGTTFPVEVRIGLIEFGAQRYRLSMARDITSRRQSEERIESSLKEKEVLLKEVNHRVKNNLQIISSLLNLQSRESLDEPAQKILQDSRDRIKAMALIHEKLYESENLSRIDFGDYLRSLASGMHESYGLGSRQIDLTIESVSTYMAIDTAIPCGLMVNELVSNAMKHAFPADHKGHINVSLSCRKDRLILSVRDDGVGLPDDFSAHAPQTLGMKLIDALVSQLDGELKITNENGTQFEVTFPIGD